MAFKKVDFTSIAEEATKKAEDKLQLLGSEIIVDIIERTQKGKDVNNKSFKKYSSSYAKTKAKMSSRVNLTVTGNMLNAISFKRISKGLRFYFIGNAEKKKALGNIGNGRKFFGIDKIQKKKIAKRIKNG